MITTALVLSVLITQPDVVLVIILSPIEYQIKQNAVLVIIVLPTVDQPGRGLNDSYIPTEYRAERRFDDY